jgi:hypothetical protein
VNAPPIRDEKKKKPPVCAQILRRLAGCDRELTDLVLDLSTLGVQNRVHAALLRLASELRRSTWRP